MAAEQTDIPSIIPLRGRIALAKQANDERRAREAENTRLSNVNRMLNTLKNIGIEATMKDVVGNTCTVDGFQFEPGGYYAGDFVMLIETCPHCRKEFRNKVHFLLDLAESYIPQYHIDQRCVSIDGVTETEIQSATTTAERIEELIRDIASEYQCQCSH